MGSTKTVDGVPPLDKGTLGGGLEVVGYAARHCKLSRKIAVRKRHKFVL